MPLQLGLFPSPLKMLFSLTNLINTPHPMSEPSVSCLTLRDVSLWSGRHGARIRGVPAAPAQLAPPQLPAEPVPGHLAELRDVAAPGARWGWGRTERLLFFWANAGLSLLAPLAPRPPNASSSAPDPTQFCVYKSSSLVLHPSPPSPDSCPRASAQTSGLWPLLSAGHDLPNTASPLCRPLSHSSASPAPGLWTGAQRRLPSPSRGSSEQDRLFLWQVSGLGSFGPLFWASGTPGSSAWGQWLLEGAHYQDRLEIGCTGWVLLEQNENFWGRAHRAGRLAQGRRLRFTSSGLLASFWAWRSLIPSRSEPSSDSSLHHSYTPMAPATLSPSPSFLFLW